MENGTGAILYGFPFSSSWPIAKQDDSPVQVFQTSIGGSRTGVTDVCTCTRDGAFTSQTRPAAPFHRNSCCLMSSLPGVSRETIKIQRNLSHRRKSGPPLNFFSSQPRAISVSCLCSTAATIVRRESTS